MNLNGKLLEQLMDTAIDDDQISLNPKATKTHPKFSK
jgi:hypothetical protein